MPVTRNARPRAGTSTARAPVLPAGADIACAPGPRGGSGPDGPARDLDAVAALGDPARRSLYAYVVAQDRPVSREEAADATHMKRATAAFHLDRLVEDGLLEAGFARLSGRTGPGAGRTSKTYRRAPRQIGVSLPPRRYELAGDILASAIEALHSWHGPAGKVSEASSAGVPGAVGGAGAASAATTAREKVAASGASTAGGAVALAAEQAGRRLASPDTDLASLLSLLGYEPRADPDGGLRLANCPFHELAARHTTLVCEMNLYLLRGILAELGVHAQAELDPAAGRRCCVTISPGKRRATAPDGG